MRNPSSAPNTFHDARRTYHFWMDDAIVDLYASKIGIYGLAIYTYLARRSKQGKSFPSIRRIAKELGCGTDKVQTTLKKLESLHLLAITPRVTDHGDRDSNLYTLEDLSHLRGVSGGDTPVPEGDTQVCLVEIHGVSGGDTEVFSLKDSQIEVEEQTPAQKILTHLCFLTKRSYRSLGLIPAALKAGSTVQECILVLDWLHVVRRQEDQPWAEKYLDHTTPFRPANFDKYLARAKEWEGHRHEPQERKIERLPL